MKIITAMNNPELNEELKKEKNIEIICKDIFYKEGILEILENEINKYNLNDCVVIEEDGYKIVGYGDLETMFIDDRNINIENNYESEMGI